MAFTTSSFPDFMDTQPENPLADYSGFDARTSDEATTLLNGNVTKLTPEEVAELIDSGEFKKHKRFIYTDSNRNNTRDEDETIKYHVIIYYGKDAVKLKQIYESVVPGDDELLVFIENQEGDIFSDQKIFISMGKNVHALFTKDETEADIVATSVFRAIGDAETGKKVVEIIRAGFGEVQNFNELQILLGFVIDQTLEAAKQTSDYVLQIPIDLLKKITDGLRSLEFTPEDWDPKSAKGSDKFVPYFFPMFSFKSNGKAHFRLGQRDIPVEEIQQKLVAQSDALFDQANTTLDGLYKNFLTRLQKISLGLAVTTVPEHSPLYPFIEALKVIVGQAIEFLIGFAIDGMLFYNAVMCGLINSLIEIVAGVFDIIRLIFWGMKVSNRITSEIKMWTEYLDNLVQALMKIDFLKVLIKVSVFLNNVLARIGSAIWNYFGSLTSADIGYFVGFVIGFIIEQVLEAIFTAGIGNAASIARRVGQGAMELLKAVWDVVVTAIKKAGYDLLKLAGNVFDMIADFIRFLAKGTDNLIRFLDDVFDAFIRKLDELVAGKKLFSRGFDQRFMDIGGYRLGVYITRSVIHGQSKAYTCVATSLRMALEKRGVKFAEDVIAEALETTVDGASILKIPEVMHQLGIVHKFKVNKFSKASFDTLKNTLKQNEIAIVSVRGPGGSHALIVDKIENGKVFLRDPLPQGKGSSYSMKADEFEQVFNRRFVTID